MNLTLLDLQITISTLQKGIRFLRHGGGGGIQIINQNTSKLAATLLHGFKVEKAMEKRKLATKSKDFP